MTKKFRYGTSVVPRFSLACLFVLMVAARLPAAAFSPGDGKLPSLNWEKRSDWLDVKTDVEPKAVGDGKADDTEALQTAFDKVASGVTIYLPPGTYRITKTLDLSRNCPQGASAVSVIGHGSDTTLAWNGDTMGTMLRDDGVTDSRFVGLTLDGKGEAAIGFLHNSTKASETEIDYWHCGFLNCQYAGIMAASEGRCALAEVSFNNCLFQNCVAGVRHSQSNDYDNTFDGCEFHGCGYGVYGKSGNFHIRNCGFYASKEADIAGSYEHGSSVRRCLSFRSKAFVDMPSCGGSAPITIQDCALLDGGDAKAFITPGKASLIFDCSFTTAKPGIYLGAGSVCVASRNGSADRGGKLGRCQTIIENLINTKIISIPPGKLKGLSGMMSRDTRFLRGQVRIPGKVFDAMRDFGAKGDDKTDDTAAVQKAIDAARGHGKDAIAYLPSGRYVITDTLKMTGKDYFVGGSGSRSCLIWKGKPGGAR